MTLRGIIVVLAVAASLVAGSSRAGGGATELPSGPFLREELRSFKAMGSVLYVAAHPDDENTRVITYLARGRRYRTAYLSLTRGDGGQNLLGPELGELLGVARTQELLAARRLDGGRQYFTRAKDFGFSKDYRETLRIWDRQAVLADVVRVIRSFRPDVIITRFSPDPGPTHGHHTASAVLAVEAFTLAGDPHAFPEQLGRLRPAQAKRILHNIGIGGAGATAVPTTAGVVKLDVTGVDPVLGETFASIAARSRAMHKTQGFGMGDAPPPPASPIESFRTLAGEPATEDILDGVDTTWNRVPEGAEIGRLTDETIARFNPDDPAQSVPALLAIRTRLSALPRDPLVDDKREQLDRIIEGCLGLAASTEMDHAEVVPGETLKLRHTVSVRSTTPVRWIAVRYPSLGRTLPINVELNAPGSLVREDARKLPARTLPSQPYWLRQRGTSGMSDVEDARLIGLPDDPPVVPVEHVVEVGGQTLVVAGEPTPAPASANEPRRARLMVIPPVSLRFASGVQLFAPGAARPVTVELTAARAGGAGTVRLEAPTDWRVSPPSRSFRLREAGERLRVTFMVTAPASSATATLGASVRVNGTRFWTRRIELRYEHIPFQLVQPAATLKALSLDLSTRGQHVGYVTGAGDDVADALEQMGYRVTLLSVADVTADRLRDLDAVVIGIRAFDTRPDLSTHLLTLFAYVEAGGTLIAQYNRAEGLGESWMAPFRLHISRDRVTDEDAPVTFLAPDHPALTTPNRITAADFAGWVQERGLYFPDRWDDRFTAVVASADPGEAPLRGGLLVARHGQGYFVYTSLAWFRQLPEGVPGAYRLFANLVSLGK